MKFGTDFSKLLNVAEDARLLLVLQFLDKFAYGNPPAFSLVKLDFILYESIIADSLYSATAPENNARPLDNITIQLYIKFIGRRLADKEVREREPEKEKALRKEKAEGSGADG